MLKMLPEDICTERDDSGKHFMRCKRLSYLTVWGKNLELMSNDDKCSAIWSHITNKTKLTGSSADSTAHIQRSYGADASAKNNLTKQFKWRVEETTSLKLKKSNTSQ